jgi:hypothetical protein
MQAAAGKAHKEITHVDPNDVKAVVDMFPEMGNAGLEGAGYALKQAGNWAPPRSRS